MCDSHTGQCFRLNEGTLERTCQNEEVGLIGDDLIIWERENSNCSCVFERPSVCLLSGGLIKRRVKTDAGQKALEKFKQS